MESFFSRIEKDKLIFSLLRFDELSNNRIDIAPASEYLQVCGRIMNKGTTVVPHKHLKTERRVKMTQESWIVLRGKVKASFYDTDNTYLCDREIGSGDVVIFYRGGHGLEVLENDTVFYEFKNGPYFGVEKDKEKIND